jgi:hypothetical protein
MKTFSLTTAADHVDVRMYLHAAALAAMAGSLHCNATQRRSYAPPCILARGLILQERIRP